jgi:hypothetical protein
VKPQWKLIGKRATVWGLLRRDDDNDRQNVNANRRPSNRHQMAFWVWGNDFSMKTYRHLFEKISSYDNLLLAFQNAKRGKTKKPYVVEFERNLQNNLYRLQWELMTRTYAPRPLTVFTVRDPKTRTISASHFRDRVIHHALVNIIGPIFESRFIHDSYANRKGKGTSAAIGRFDCFLKKVTSNGKLVSWGGGIPKRQSSGWLRAQSRYLPLFRIRQSEDAAFHHPQEDIG